MSTEEAKTETASSVIPPLSDILDSQARVEVQVGEIYVNFAATFGQDSELRALWSAMALEEGGHAALLRAVNKGLLSGVFQAKSFLLPLEVLDSLTTRVAEYHRQAQEGVSLDQALQITWELEFSTNLESKDKHVSRLREVIQQYTTNEGLRREVKFLSAERFPR